MLSEREVSESLSGHATRNRVLLAELQSKGNLDASYSVEHHFWAPTQQAAAKLAYQLYRLGYLVLAISPVHQDGQTTIWNVEAGKTRSLAQAGSDEVSEELVRLAAQFDATYDGWGTSV